MHIPGEVKFLVCVDSSDECKAALRFACMRAKNSAGSVCILYVIEPNDIQHFAGRVKCRKMIWSWEKLFCYFNNSFLIVYFFRVFF